MLNPLEILKTKTSNHHMVQRYLNFVGNCNKKNQTSNGYLEEHHICPKADDLFPEYCSFADFPENKAILTARQHIIAHVMLWKIYGGSQSYALDCMLGKFNSNTNKCLQNRTVPNSIMIRYHSKVREAVKSLVGERAKGKSAFKDTNGRRYYLETNSPLIKELGLVGNNTGYRHSNKTIDLIKKVKFKRRTVKLHFLDCKVVVPLLSKRHFDLVAQGWTHKLTDGDREFIKEQTYKIVAEKMAGRSRYYNQNGDFVGMFTADNPIIQEQNLNFKLTERGLESALENQKMAASSLLGTKTYNNGVTEGRFFEKPVGSNWVLGRLPRNAEWDEKQRAAVAIHSANHVFWNDGKVTIKLPIGETPVGDQWTKGMVKRQPIDVLFVPDGYLSKYDFSNQELSAEIKKYIANENGEVMAARCKTSYITKTKELRDLVVELAFRTATMPDTFGLNHRIFMMDQGKSEPDLCVICGGAIRPKLEKKKDQERKVDTCSLKCFNAHPDAAEIRKATWAIRKQQK